MGAGHVRRNGHCVLAGSVLLVLATTLSTGCTRVASGATEPPPTYIPQPTPDPTMTSGNREQILDAYRGVRDGLFRRIKQRFPIVGAPNV